MQDAADEGNEFSLDVLFIDDHAIPTLVEVKRSTDTRIRREVAAQMLDYACRVKNLETEDLRTAFVNNYADNPAVMEMYDQDRFWLEVEKNLKAEHYRLIFAADLIPELRVLQRPLDSSFCVFFCPFNVHFA